MKIAFLIRNFPTKRGVFGLFIIPSHGKNWYSLENPDFGNAVNISCIPVGDYVCKWTESKKLKKFTYEILNVPGRTGIRFHPFNMIEETKGCIGLGKRIQHSGKETKILDSRMAISEFENLMEQKLIKLKIRWCVGLVI